MNNVLDHLVKEKSFDGVYLFVGNKSAAEDEAKLFEKYIMCESHSACGHCPGCKKVDAGAHADITYIQKSKNKYTVDDVRPLMSDAYQKAFEGGKKIFFLSGCESMEDIVQNKLLKILEEPPANTVIILSTASLSNMLPTILSRCTVVRLDEHSPENAVDDLIKQHGAGSNEARVISRSAKGDVSFSAELYGTGYMEIRNDIFNISTRLLSANKMAYSAYLNKIMEYSDHLDLVFLSLSTVFNDFICIKTGQKDGIINIDITEYMDSALGKVSVSKISSVYSIIEKANSTYLSCSNINKKLLIEKMLIEILEKVVSNG